MRGEGRSGHPGDPHAEGFLMFLTGKTALVTGSTSGIGLAVARALAAKQAPRLKRLDPIVARRRLIGMLQRRGFDYDEIKPVVDEVLSDPMGE
jgi:NAD(P)-dependent dehydrogenase (short-subunit alcohol dehydrogenase family)